MMAATAQYTDSMRARAATLLESARTWTWGRRKADGVQFVLFASRKPGHAYYTSLLGCSCSGYLYRGMCSHSLAVQQHVEQVRAAAGRKALRTYEEMYRGDGDQLTDAF